MPHLACDSSSKRLGFQAVLIGTVEGINSLKYKLVQALCMVERTGCLILRVYSYFGSINVCRGNDHRNPIDV